jgi:hypothetical protein
MMSANEFESWLTRWLLWFWSAARATTDTGALL